MTRKKTKAQEFLEAKVIHKYGGKIDLKELWKREDKELDPELVRGRGDS
jgi:hypothetical protein